MKHTDIQQPTSPQIHQTVFSVFHGYGIIIGIDADNPFAPWLVKFVALEESIHCNLAEMNRFSNN